jgi:hypothetical protein
MGRKYWKKRSYIFQGFVVEDPIREEKTPENPIRRFIIGPQIYQIIRSALMDPELEELPTDYMRGVDFRIAKTSKGGFADYSTSKWSRRERAISDADKAAIEQFGLHNLSDFLPKKPTDVELKVMKEMFEASVDGEAYDMDRWGQYFKPAGMGGGGSATGAGKAAASTDDEEAGAYEAPVAQSKPTVAAKPAELEAEADASSGSEASGRAADIIAMIRKRQST